MTKKKKSLPLREMHQMLTTAAEALQPPLVHTLEAAGTDYLYQRAAEALATKDRSLAMTLIAYALVRDAATQPVQPNTASPN